MFLFSAGAEIPGNIQVVCLSRLTAAKSITAIPEDTKTFDRFQYLSKPFFSFY